MYNECCQNKIYSNTVNVDHPEYWKTTNKKMFY